MEKPIRFRKWVTRMPSEVLLFWVVGAWMIYVFYLPSWLSEAHRAAWTIDWGALVKRLADIWPWVGEHEMLVGFALLFASPVAVAWLALRFNVKGVVIWQVPENTLIYRRSLPWGLGRKVLPLGLTGVSVGRPNGPFKSNDSQALWRLNPYYILVRLRILGKRYYPLIEAGSEIETQAMFDLLDPLVERDQ